jgi:hypothetical protein
MKEHRLELEEILEAKEILDKVKQFDTQVRSAHLENEQWFLDWQDKLNEISVK